jgi:hypothetical protein
VLSFLLGSCAALPDVDSGVCGNGVVEPPEDCDTFSPSPSLLCLPKGENGQCHFDCRPLEHGGRRACPTGWGCDAQGICRAPTGDFVAGAPVSAAGAWSLASADFDGDGRDDIVSMEKPDSIGATNVTFHYFDGEALKTETVPFPKRMAAISIADLTADGRGDVVFVNQNWGIGVLAGQSDRSWVPETAGSYRFPQTVVRMVSVSDEEVEGSNAVLGLASINGMPGLYGPDAQGLLVKRGSLPAPVETLVGDPVVGDLFGDHPSSPCRELALAFQGSLSFFVLDTCTTDAMTGDILWRPEATTAEVRLEPPRPIDAAPVIADVNGDGNLDVLIGAGSTYVAYGDGQRLATAVPYHRPFGPTHGVPDDAMPLAAGDFTGDHVVDFVFGETVLVSVHGPDGALAGYAVGQVNLGPPWTKALIADFNANGFPDVVAAARDRVGIDFFNGTGSPFLAPFSLPTPGPMQSLAVADLDGDLVNDLAVIVKGESAAERDSLLIAFGNAAGPPDTPRVAARIANIDQLASDNELGRGNLVIAYTETLPNGKNGVLAFFAGSADRLPFAPYELVDVAEGSVFQSAALDVAVGRFRGAPQKDILSLAASQGGHPSLQMWMLPAASAPGSVAVRLPMTFDPRWRPLVVDGIHVAVHAATAAGDLDGDGRDEALWAAPADDDAHCGVLVLGTADGEGGKLTLVTRQTVWLDVACSAAQLTLADADGDGSRDLFLLSGGPGDRNRRLLLVRNDGHGTLSASDAVQLSAEGDSPQGFALLTSASSPRPSVVYVTDGFLARTEIDPASQGVSAPQRLLDLVHGVGVAAGDVDGDGVMDLVVAGAGNLRVLRARLAAP